MDQIIEKQGQDLHELLQLFRQATTEPLSSFILQTPTHKDTKAAEQQQNEMPRQDKQKQRKSPRLKKKGIKGKPIIKMAQELVAKKCGIIQEDQELDTMTLQQYLDMYKEPLSQETIEAITKLTTVATEKKKKKKDKKKEDKMKTGTSKKKGKKTPPTGDGVVEA
jgi:hypothetical protein